MIISDREKHFCNTQFEHILKKYRVTHMENWYERCTIGLQNGFQNGNQEHAILVSL